MVPEKGGELDLCSVLCSFKEAEEGISCDSFTVSHSPLNPRFGKLPPPDPIIRSFPASQSSPILPSLCVWKVLRRILPWTPPHFFYNTATSPFRFDKPNIDNTTTRTGGCGEGGGAEPLQRLSFAPQLISTQNPNGENNTLTHYSADAFTGAHVKTLLCRRSDAPAVCSSPKWACLSPGRQRAECSAAGSPALGVAARRAHQQIGH